MKKWKMAAFTATIAMVLMALLATLNTADNALTNEATQVQTVAITASPVTQYDQEAAAQQAIANTKDMPTAYDTGQSNLNAMASSKYPLSAATKATVARTIMPGAFVRLV